VGGEMPELTFKTGEYWYRMEDENDKITGYNHLIIKKRDNGGVKVNWDMGMGFNGGTYKEDRTMELDSECRLLSVSGSLSGKELSEAKREGNRLVGHAVRKGEKTHSPIDIEIPDDASSGMQFVITMFLPFDQNAVIHRRLLHEMNAFSEAETPSKISYVKQEQLEWEGETIMVHRFDVHQNKGVLPIWINENHEIVKIDWGGGNFIVLSRIPTRNLVKTEAS
jgi:hypothetical protein